MKVNGAKIKELREKQGWSKEDFAGEFTPRVTRQAIESWERGAVGTFRTLNRIAEALKVSPEFLTMPGNGDTP
jgi:transcriptional regulator with XRE-family HTH domain